LFEQGNFVDSHLFIERKLAVENTTNPIVTATAPNTTVNGTA